MEEGLECRQGLSVEWVGVDWGCQKDNIPENRWDYMQTRRLNQDQWLNQPSSPENRWEGSLLVKNSKNILPLFD